MTLITAFIFIEAAGYCDRSKINHLHHNSALVFSHHSVVNRVRAVSGSDPSGAHTEKVRMVWTVHGLSQAQGQVRVLQVEACELRQVC